MERYFFNHLPKCAGTTIAEHFKVIFGEKSVLHILTEELCPDLCEHHRFVYGHVTRSFEESVSENFRRFTIVRSPVARVLSHYFFLQQIEDLSVLGMASAADLTLEEFVNSPDIDLRDCVENRQSRQLFGLKLDDVPPGQEIKIFDTHLPCLERFDIIGLHESLQETLDLLSWKFSFPPISSGVKMNVTNKIYHINEIDMRIIQNIERKNRLDELLYFYVQKKFLLQYREMMDDLLSHHYFFEKNGGVTGLSTVKFENNVPGTGWYAAEYEDGWLRWMGSKPGATVLFTVPVAPPNVIKIYARFLAEGLTFKDLAIYVNGVVSAFTVDIVEGVGYVLHVPIKNAGPRDGTRLEIRPHRSRPPIEEDGRELALAVSRVDIVASGDH